MALSNETSLGFHLKAGVDSYLTDTDYIHYGTYSNTNTLTSFLDLLSNGTGTTYASRLGTSSGYLTYSDLNPIYLWYTATTDPSTDKLIDKWFELENFLSGVTTSDTLTGLLAQYVTLSTTQTITGSKTFSNPISGDLLGNSTTADRLKSTTLVGSATLPIYFNGGVPVACTASSVFSSLSSNTTNAVSITVAGLNRVITANTLKTSLGLGDNAYTSTAYLPLSAGSNYPLTGNLYCNKRIYLEQATSDYNTQKGTSYATDGGIYFTEMHTKENGSGSTSAYIKFTNRGSNTHTNNDVLTISNEDDIRITCADLITNSSFSCGNIYSSNIYASDSISAAGDICSNNIRPHNGSDGTSNMHIYGNNIYFKNSSSYIKDSSIKFRASSTNNITINSDENKIVGSTIFKTKDSDSNESTYSVPIKTGTGTYTLATTSDLDSYLPLAGGTMTGNISYKGTNATNSMIRFLNNTEDAYGNGISIGGGGVVVIGAGESASNMSVSGGTENTYILSDTSNFIESNCNTIANRIGFQVDTSGNIIPVKAESGNNNVLNIGSSSYKWANIYATTFNGNVTGDCSGNAATATKLQTGRYLWGNLFDGSANITGTIAASKIYLNGTPSEYDKSKTYALNTYVTYSGKVYKCTTAITTAEAWTSGHWTEVSNYLYNGGDTYNVGTTNIGHIYLREGSSIGFRDSNSGYYTLLRYDTTGNEALILGMKQAATSFIIKSGDSGTTGTTTTGFTASGFTPSFLVKRLSVYINSLIANNATPTYNLNVAGTTNITGATTLGSTLGVTGATTLSSTLGVTGKTTLTSLDATSTVNLTGTTSIDSLTAGNLVVTGATSLSGNVNAGNITTTGLVYINNTTDVGLTQDGALTIGDKSGENIGIDGNEIAARNNGSASILYLNNDGGKVLIGNGGLLVGTGGATINGNLSITGSITVTPVELSVKETSYNSLILSSWRKAYKLGTSSVYYSGVYVLLIKDTNSTSGKTNYYTATVMLDGNTSGREAVDEIPLNSAMATGSDTEVPSRIFAGIERGYLYLSSQDTTEITHTLTIKVIKLMNLL